MNTTNELAAAQERIAELERRVAELEAEVDRYRQADRDAESDRISAALDAEDRFGTASRIAAMRTRDLGA